MFELQGLDHVALRVGDLAASAAWYERVLGLERVRQDVHREWPVILVTPGGSRSGVALFPIRPAEGRAEAADRGGATVDHFAFRVDADNFERARRHLHDLGIHFEFQDHSDSHSIYFADPDGHRVEIETHLDS